MRLSLPPLLIQVDDPCWRCRARVVTLELTPRGSFVVACAHCEARTTSGKPTREKALAQWAASSRRQRAKAAAAEAPACAP